MGKQVRAKRNPRKKRASMRPLLAGAVFAMALAVVAGVAFAYSSGSDESDAPVSAGSASTTATGSGRAAVRVAGVEVAHPLADRGRLPLNTPVRQQWMLKNTGETPVTLGKPKIEVLEGC